MAIQDSTLLRRPMMLKDFLRDDSSHSCVASPPPAHIFPIKSTAAVSSKSNKPPLILLRSFSKKAAATKISAIHHVVKLLHFANSLKSPSVLPRSFSRKLTRRSTGKTDIFGDVSEVKVKVKDILRWRSFRDVVEDKSTPLDFPPSPNRSTTTTATTTTTTSSSCSKRSSWCDSDFTAEELPPWGGENKEFWVKNAATFRDSKGEWSFEEYEQQSPVSVLDSPFRQVEDFVTPPHPILSNIQRAKCNLPRGIQELNFDEKIVVSEGLDAVERKAKELFSYVREDSKSYGNDQVIFDFFMHELTINGKLHDDEFDLKLLRIAKTWIIGEFDESYEWEDEDKRESYVRDMEKEISWNKFKQEDEEVSKDLEIEVLDDLIDDLLADFYC